MITDVDDESWEAWKLCSATGDEDSLEEEDSGITAVDDESWEAWKL